MQYLEYFKHFRSKIIYYLQQRSTSLLAFSSHATSCVQVWGDQVHLGRYDLFNEEDATLEGLALMNRAAALTNEVLMSKLFPDAHGVNDETTVMEMGAGYGEFARALVKKHGCKVNLDCLLD